MTRTLVALLVVISVPALRSEDGLFIGCGSEGRQTLEKKELVLRIPVQRAPVTYVILRPDTETPKKFWLEMHMGDYRDPGDFVYVIVADDRLIEGEMFVRASERDSSGCKWAMAIEDEKAGKTIEEALRRAYGLER